MTRWRTWIAVLAIGLVGLLSIRTLSLSDPAQDTLDLPPAPAIDADAAADRLAGALRFPTVAGGDPAPFLALHRYLAEQFPRVHGELSRELVGEMSLLYHWRGRDPNRPPLLLLAHQDVVPAGNAEDWRYPPFAGTLADGAVWGRGAVDDKSGVLAILEAVEGLLDEGFQPDRDAFLAFGHDEEIGGAEGAARIAALLETRGVRPALVLDEGGAITRGRVPGLSSPVATVGIAEKGYISLALTTVQAGGHSSMPPPQTAVGILAAAVARLEAHPFPARIDGATESMFRYLAPHLPLGQRVALANRWLLEPLLIRVLDADPAMGSMLRTTTAATMFSGSEKDNVLPTRARAVVNFRILPGDDVQSVTRRVIEVIDDGRIQVEPLDGFGNDPSSVSDPGSAAFGLVSAAIRASNDEPVVVAPYLVMGGTDSRHFAGVGEQVLRFSGATLTSEEIAALHGIDERIRVEEHARSIRFYATVLRHLEAL